MFFTLLFLEYFVYAFVCSFLDERLYKFVDVWLWKRFVKLLSLNMINKWNGLCIPIFQPWLQGIETIADRREKCIIMMSRFGDDKNGDTHIRNVSVASYPFLVMIYLNPPSQYWNKPWPTLLLSIRLYLFLSFFSGFQQLWLSGFFSQISWLYVKLWMEMHACSLFQVYDSSKQNFGALISLWVLILSLQVFQAVFICLYYS